MKSVTISLFALLIISTNCFAQPDSEPEVTDVTRVTIINPGIGYEKRIGKNQSLNLHGYMRLSAYFSYSDALGTSSGINLDPAIGIRYRYYYNAIRRADKGKRTAMNSMNYLSVVHESILIKKIVYDGVSSKTTHPFLNIIGAVWGMQRNYQNRFSLDFNTGMGYMYTKQAATGFTLLIGLDIGFWLNKRK